MNKQHTKEIKVRNLDAHLSVLKQEVKVQENALAGVVLRRKEEEESLQIVRSEILLAQKELQSVIQKSGQITRAHEAEKERLNKVEEELGKWKMELFAEREDLDEYIESATLAFERDRQEIENEIEDRQKLLEEVKKDSEYTIKTYESRVDSLLDDITKYSKEVESIKFELSNTGNKLSEAQKSLQTVLKQIDEAQSALAETRQSNKTYEENLQRKADYVDQKEADLKVWERRLKKWSEEYFPDVEIVV